MTIDKIILHHSGGLGTNNYASTVFLTPEDIEQAHRQRWDFRSSLGKYAGYNFIYDPKTRQITQHRAIGEETAHTKGYNFSSIGICIIGNYNLDKNGIPVDDLQPHTRIDIVNFLIDLCKGNYRDFVVVPNTVIQLTPFRIFPHRAFSMTDCYGTAIDDNYFKEQVKLRIYPKISELQNLLEQLNLWALKIKSQLLALGGSDRECLGNIIINNNNMEEEKEVEEETL